MPCPQALPPTDLIREAGVRAQATTTTVTILEHRGGTYAYIADDRETERLCDRGDWRVAGSWTAGAGPHSIGLPAKPAGVRASA